MYDWVFDEIVVMMNDRSPHWNESGNMDCYCGQPLRYVGHNSMDYVSPRQNLNEPKDFSIKYWHFRRDEVDIPKTKLLHALLESRF